MQNFQNFQVLIYCQVNCKYIIKLKASTKCYLNSQELQIYVKPEWNPLEAKLLGNLFNTQCILCFTYRVLALKKRNWNACRFHLSTLCLLVVHSSLHSRFVSSRENSKISIHKLGNAKLKLKVRCWFAPKVKARIH